MAAGTRRAEAQSQEVDCLKVQTSPEAAACQFYRALVDHVLVLGLAVSVVHSAERKCL